MVAMSQQLLLAFEEIQQAYVPAYTGEHVRLVHARHRHASTLCSERVTRMRERLLLDQERIARGKPLLL